MNSLIIRSTYISEYTLIISEKAGREVEKPSWFSNVHPSASREWMDDICMNTNEYTFHFSTQDEIFDVGCDIWRVLCGGRVVPRAWGRWKWSRVPDGKTKFQHLDKWRVVEQVTAFLPCRNVVGGPCVRHCTVDEGQTGESLSKILGEWRSGDWRRIGV